MLDVVALLITGRAAAPNLLQHRSNSVPMMFVCVYITVRNAVCIRCWLAKLLCLCYGQAYNTRWNTWPGVSHREGRHQQWLYNIHTLNDARTMLSVLCSILYRFSHAYFCVYSVLLFLFGTLLFCY